MTNLLIMSYKKLSSQNIDSLIGKVRKAEGTGVCICLHWNRFKIEWEEYPSDQVNDSRLVEGDP